MAAREPVSAAILCGGAGRRLGGADKGQLMVAGRSILDRLLDALRPLTPHVMIINRDGLGATPPGVRRLPDLVADSGVLGGIYTALEHSPTDRVIVVACDMPFVSTTFLDWLSRYAEDADVVVPRDRDGRHPICGVFHRRVASALKARIDARRLRVDEALAALDVREVGADAIAPFDTDGHLLLNVNTPEEYAQATSGYDTP
jgi:molybdopterin-guanine dinucleotide biosynthesis protein A